MNDKPIEGYFIVTVDDLIFEVKGVVQPESRLMAYLRYAPDPAGDRLSKSGMKYRKIYDLSGRIDYLERKHPEHLWYDDVHDRVLQTVPHDRIAYVLNPVDGLRNLRDRRDHVSKLQAASIDFSERLVEHCDIEWGSIGLTGSQLVGLDNERSDIDLVIYGIESGQKVYSTLRDKYEMIPELEKYSGEDLDSIVSFRWGKANRWWEILRDIESRKVLQGLFRSNDFFIRIVKTPEEMGYRYGEVKYQDRGRVVVKCLIENTDASMFTPCVYHVSSDDIPELMILTSYRGRFTEHVHTNMIVRAHGKLELVEYFGSRKSHLQVVLGENPDDYLIPI